MKKYVPSDSFLIILFMLGILLLGAGGMTFPLFNILGIILIGSSGLLSTTEYQR